MAIPTLDQLGLLHQTDKASGRHNYLRDYDVILTPKRSQARTVLEIGVKTGASLRMWRDYFSSADIIGIDVNPTCKEHEDGRIIVEIGKQTDAEFLDRVVAGRSLDVVVDDGSHRWAHQIGTFLHLWPKLEAAGIYIVEDLHTSLAANATSYGEPPSEAASTFFSRLARTVCTTGAVPDEALEENVGRLRKTVAQIIFGARYCILQKRSAAFR
jgi:hypothetical protein